MALCRFSTFSKEEHINDFDIEANSIFSLVQGPLFIKFENGAIIGFASDPRKNSVVCWAEESSGGVEDTLLPGQKEGDYVFDAKDDPFWSKFIGSRIFDVKILCGRGVLSYVGMDNEVGLTMLTDKGEFLITHGLHDCSDDFSVITRDQLFSRIELEENTSESANRYVGCYCGSRA